MTSWSDREVAKHPGNPVWQFVLFAPSSTREHQAPHFIAGTPYFDIPSVINSVDFDAF